MAELHKVGDMVRHHIHAKSLGMVISTRSSGTTDSYGHELHICQVHWSVKPPYPTGLRATEEWYYDYHLMELEGDE